MLQNLFPRLQHQLRIGPFSLKKTIQSVTLKFALNEKEGRGKNNRSLLCHESIREFMHGRILYLPKITENTVKITIQIKQKYLLRKRLKNFSQIMVSSC